MNHCIRKQEKRQKFVNDVTSGAAKVLVKTDDRVEVGSYTAAVVVPPDGIQMVFKCFCYPWPNNSLVNCE